MTLREYLFQNWKNIVSTNLNKHILIDARYPKLTRLYVNDEFKRLIHLDYPPKVDNCKYISKHEFEVLFHCNLNCKDDYLQLVFEESNQFSKSTVEVIIPQTYLENDFGVKFIDIHTDLGITNLLSPKEVCDLFSSCNRLIQEINLTNHTLKLEDKTYSFDDFAKHFGIIIQTHINQLKPPKVIIDSNQGLPGLVWVDSNTLQVEYKDTTITYSLDNHLLLLLYDFGIYVANRDYPKLHEISFAKEKDVTDVREDFAFNTSPLKHFEFPDEVLHIYIDEKTKSNITDNFFILTGVDNKFIYVNQVYDDENVKFINEPVFTTYPYEFMQEYVNSSIQSVFTSLLMIQLATNLDSVILLLLRGKLENVLLQPARGIL